MSTYVREYSSTAQMSTVMHTKVHEYVVLDMYEFNCICQDELMIRVLMST